MNLKEENEKLRDLLRRVYNYVPISDQIRIDSALSHQAEPAPAQDEQQPVGVVLKVTGEDWNSVDFRIDLQSLPVGTKLYAAPIAQTAPQPEQSVPEELFDGHAVVRLIKARRAALSAQETNKI